MLFFAALILVGLGVAILGAINGLGYYRHCAKYSARTNRAEEFRMIALPILLGCCIMLMVGAAALAMTY